MDYDQRKLSRCFRAALCQQLSYTSFVLSVLLHEFDGDIPRLRNDVLLLPRSEPLRAHRILRTGVSKAATLLVVEAIGRPRTINPLLHRSNKLPTLLEYTRSFQNTTQIFYCLTLAIYLHAEAFKHPEYVKSCVMYLRYMCG
jgi:hypothetical protein